MAEGGVPGVEDVARLGSWLASNGITRGDEPAAPPAVRLIGGGRSNLTYRLDVGAADGPGRGQEKSSARPAGAASGSPRFNTFTAVGSDSA